MTVFHAIMIGECGEDFGVEVEATSLAAAYDSLREDYPESRIESVMTRAQMEQRRYSYQGYGE